MRCLLKTMLPVIVLTIVINHPLNAQKANGHITLTDELRQLYDVSQLPLYRANTYVAETSSYDRTGGNDDGFAGTYSYIRRNSDSSLVMFDVTGSGVINRIATPTPTDDILDFYIDDTSRPAYSIKYSDLFSGNVYPFVHPVCGNQLGGFYCYYPIMFNKSCRIISRGKKLQFHQIQYRLYGNNVSAKSFSANLDNGEKDALEKISALWNKESKTIADFATGTVAVKTTAVINAGETKTIFSTADGGRIAGIELDGAGTYTGLDKDVDIKITWDDETTPAVYCPVADFFGYAFGTPSMQSLVAGVKDGKNYCYYPMPFDKKATVQLIYRSTGAEQPAKNIKAVVYYSKMKRDTAAEGKFYAAWQGNAKPAECQPHVFLNTRGRGHYVATILQAQGLHPGMTYFFEGDDSTVIDGQARIHGTGSEDYFNGGWYALPDRWDGKYSLPIYGCLDYSLPFCRTGGYRLYLADKVSFEKSIYQSMEHGPEGNNVPVSYTSLSFYYCSMPPSTYVQPANALAKVFVPDTMMLYPQLLHFNIDGEITTKTSWAYNTGGESFAFTINDESVLGIDLKQIPNGHYELFADIVKSPQGCDFSAWQRQNKVSGLLSTNSTAKERINQLRLGDINITDFQKSVTLQFKTTATRNEFYFNRFILVRHS